MALLVVRLEVSDVTINSDEEMDEIMDGLEVAIRQQCHFEENPIECIAAVTEEGNGLKVLEVIN